MHLVELSRLNVSSASWLQVSNHLDIIAIKIECPSPPPINPITTPLEFQSILFHQKGVNLVLINKRLLHFSLKTNCLIGLIITVCLSLLPTHHLKTFGGFSPFAFSPLSLFKNKITVPGLLMIKNSVSNLCILKNKPKNPTWTSIHLIHSSSQGLRGVLRPIPAVFR